ncbi:MAG: bifunctional phosphoribosyl-AMP cyclohydrolase/phosphoribosyl-ATP diphosphatase HisIE [Bacteroidetes bacterium]|nr:bifunctional phosphoribosyl-AMP cyclohydrolase/phosphoribosyl-ATP diphosphatase HisIE [Bacteroidota bacterium]MDA0874638.1 bifunctional phosphoribosyl-AMP cyclohydrolase/phosphoribosyl-ATP diphosphatase HisIE [Bacteroidota bacterium]
MNADFTPDQIDTLTFDEAGLVPAIVQDAETHHVLMLGWMNAEAIERSFASGQVTFFSRSRQQLWTKGETSGNHLALVGMKADCDRDALLVKAHPHGPTCHTGTDTCWEEENRDGAAFLRILEGVIAQREADGDDKSYTVRLLQAGAKKIAQKVGEEGVETALEGVAGPDDKLAEESADLLYHLLVLLRSRGMKLEDVTNVLRARHGG